MATEAKWSDFASRDSARTIAAANQLLPPWITLLLACVIAWQLANIVWMLVPGTSVGDPVIIPAGQAPIGKPATGGADVQSIADTHIFGEADAEDAPPPVFTEGYANVEESRANLELRGTLASPYDDMSAAIIYDGTREEKVYLIGDPIVGRTKLHDVLPEYVVLDENGNLTRLSLPEEFKQAAVTPVRRQTTPRASQANTESIQSVVSQNVARLADVIRPTPYFVNGQQQGYRVYPGRDRRQFAALGLRPGDLIKDIDGQSLSDPTQAMKIFQSLGSSSQVSVTVERDGQPEVIVLKTDQLKLGEDESQ